MKSLLIDTETRKASVVEIDDNDHLNEYYRYLKCNIVDITSRKVGGKYYDFIIYDEGMLTDSPVVSALDPEGQPALVGNLLICNFNAEEGTEESLTDEDVARLQEFVAYGFEQNKETGEVVPRIFLTNVDY